MSYLAPAVRSKTSPMKELFFAQFQRNLFSPGIQVNACEEEFVIKKPTSAYMNLVCTLTLFSDLGHISCKIDGDYFSTCLCFEWHKVKMSLDLAVTVLIHFSLLYSRKETDIKESVIQYQWDCKMELSEKSKQEDKKVLLSMAQAHNL